MCGIFFSTGFMARRETIDCVSHRGPDVLNWSQDLYQGIPVSLGHARLKVIDLSENANQPFSGTDERYTIVFNGMIYNYLELRNELNSLGKNFQTESDTEVLLASFIQWGVECLDRLSGMFAFVIWDNQTGRVFAARDRYGIKPLYVKIEKGKIAFASEIKQLLLLQNSVHKMNVEAAFDFLEGGLTDHMQQTLFDGIKQIRGGEFVDVFCTSIPKYLPVIRWHSLNIAEEPVRSSKKTFKKLLSKAVKSHMVSDVKLGSCLSGGLDSSALVIEADKISDGAIETFTAGCRNSIYDESAYAEELIRNTKQCEFNYVELKDSEILEHLHTVIRHQDEPFGSTGIISQWNVFRAAKKQQVKVMLDGQGADELLAGYHSIFPVYYADMISSLKFITLYRSLCLRKKQGVYVLPEILMGVKIILSKLGFKWLTKQYRIFFKKTRHQYHWLNTPVFKSVFKSGRDDILHAVRTREGLLKNRSVTSECILMLRSLSLPKLLRFEDRNSMAHGIESRVPYLDIEFSEFLLNLPLKSKIKNGETKSILRHSMKELPQIILNRSDKLGFATPQDEWIRRPLKKSVLHTLNDLENRFPDMFTRQTIDDFIDVIHSNNRSTDRLWRVYIFGLWAEIYDIAI